jgi:mRNA-degrading endonuclease RelE of RelBE toxin-antitoxin system
MRALEPAAWIECEDISSEERQWLMSKLKFQFTKEAASDLANDGLKEEQAGNLSGWSGNQSEKSKNIWLTEMAAKDFGSLSPDDQNKIQDIFNKLVDGDITFESGLPINNSGGVLLRVNEWRLIGKENADKIVIYAVGNWSINPCTKVWRYLDQAKAEDFLRTSTLYFRRLDLLEDEFEGTPSLQLALAHWQAYKEVFSNPKVEDSFQIFEYGRRSEYTCCWRLDNHESWLFWKQYCPTSGGLAIQTTYRKLRHLHISLIEKHSGKFPGIRFERVKYLDHRTDESLSSEFPSHHSVKRPVFSDESEIRLLLSRFGNLVGSDKEIEAQLALLPEGEKLEIDLYNLLDSVVINPFASQQQQVNLMCLMREYRSTLSAKLGMSEVNLPPVNPFYSKRKNNSAESRIVQRRS